MRYDDSCDTNDIPIGISAPLTRDVSYTVTIARCRLSHLLVVRPHSRTPAMSRVPIVFSNQIRTCDEYETSSAFVAKSDVSAARSSGSRSHLRGSVRCSQTMEHQMSSPRSPRDSEHFLTYAGDCGFLDYTSWYPQQQQLQGRFATATAAFYSKTSFTADEVLQRIQIPSCPDEEPSD